jgi:nucleoside-diphosphate-sugar epimerase
MMSKRILVAGAGGFIGGHLTAQLLSEGHAVRGVDRKPLTEWFQRFEAAENFVADLSMRESCHRACQKIDHVYNLASDMGGMGYLAKHKAKCMLSVLTDTHLLQAALENGCERFFYASSASVYHSNNVDAAMVIAFRESDAYPADPLDGYGWEKLFAERMCRHFREDFGLATRVARFHNIYGPYGSWDDGREKAPAAMIRKVIHARATGTNAIEIWGDGRQTRSFTYVDDCITGIRKIMESDVVAPLNLGSSELITINGLVDVVEEIAGVKMTRQYNLGAPRGINGRNSDNSLIQSYLGWEPTIPLRQGMAKTYAWVLKEYEASARDEATKA